MSIEAPCSPARGLRLRALCSLIERRLQNPSDSIRQGFEALRPSARAANSVSLNVCLLPGRVNPENRNAGEFRNDSFSSSIRLPRNSVNTDNPVMFPPGRARLATSPLQQDRYQTPSRWESCSSLSCRPKPARCRPNVTIRRPLSRTSSAVRSVKAIEISFCLSHFE